MSYNRLLLSNAAEAYENQLSTVKSLLFNIYFDQNTTTLSVKLSLNMMDRLDYLKASQLSSKIETSVENPSLYLDNILVYYISPSYVISKGGGSEAASLFEREFSSHSYPPVFWKQQLDEPYEYHVFENGAFSFSSGYTRELIPIVLKMTPRNYMAIAFLDAGRMNQSFHQVPGSELTILDKDGELLYSTSSEWPDANLLQTLFADEEDTIVHQNHYYFMQRGTDTGFTYVSSLPVSSIRSQMSSLNLTSALLLILSVCCGILVSIYYTRRMDAPVKEIVSSLISNKPASLSGNIAEFKLIHHQITHLIQEKNDILSDLVRKKALLSNYSYLHKVKRIKSDLSELSETFTEQPYRLILFQLNFKKTVLKQHKMSTEQVAYALKEYIELAMGGFTLSHTLQIENDQILTMASGDVPMSKLEEKLHKLKKVFDQDTLYCLVSIALSRVYPAHTALGDAYDEVLDIAKTAKLVEETQLLTLADTGEAEYHPFLAEKDQEFYMNLQAGNASMCIELVHRMLDYMALKESSALRFRQFAEQTIETTLQVIAAHRMEIEDQTELYNSIGLLDDCYTTSQLKQFFTRFLSISGSLIQSKKEEQNDTTDGAMSYLEEHYAEDISLDIVASHLGITGAYLSALMKEKTGVNFSDHLNNIRIRKAKELLDSTDLSIQEIGQRIGYRNVTSFIRMFKKLTALTPGDYRKKSRLQKM
ncbi:helix-turn-helix domain-containing protein [Paenibacillus senegalensis]|uniref:helix-turn-helix domain-containing protein n=1 Tax=Paenibacillus senegalensis TaxID=1465766 RepID=UPI0012F7A90D|nr:helix-turn-helix domain-containing protein [Paenibacillus senegalensis]